MNRGGAPGWPGRRLSRRGQRYIHGVADPDMALLEQWRAGDREAGQALFARHFREIYRFFEYRVGGDADDLAQRTFLACVTARDQFRGLSSFRTFLFAIARNELYTFRKDEGAHLESYGWESKAAGTVHIPIEEAMKLTVERGLPVQAVDAAQPSTLGMMPADSSAGRTLEKRRQ